MDYSLPPSIVRQYPQVFPWQSHGRNVWVKKRRPNKQPILWWLQRLAYRLTGILLVLPPGRPVGDNVRFEVSMLRKLAALGVRVPEVLHVQDDYFVMSDTGPSLEQVLASNPGGAPGLILEAARELRRFHDLGMAHGGAQIKNLTVFNNEIHFIDFEEFIPEKRLEQFQLRDLFLYLLSLERTGNNPDLEAICAAYGGDRFPETLTRVRRAILQLGMVRYLKSSFFSRWSMRDIRSLIQLVSKAEKIPAPEASC